MATREALLAEAERRGLLTPEQRRRVFGTISQRPGLLESSLPVAGQIVGGIAGSPGGVPGVIAGATAGAVAGRAGQQVFRTIRGERIPFRQAATELGGEAAITAGSEAVFPFVGRALKPVVKPLAEKAVRKVIRPAASSFFRFMTGIPQESTERLIQQGSGQLLTKKAHAREGGIRLAEQFLENAKQALTKVNTQLAKVVMPLRKSPKSAIPSQPIQKVVDMVESEFAGIGGPILGETKDVLSPVRKAIEDVRLIAGGDFIPLDTAIRARQQLDDVIYTGKAQGLISPRQVAALQGLRQSFSNTIHQKFPRIAKVDASRHAIGEALEVIERYSPESVTNVDKLGRMIDAFEETKVGPAVREALIEADRAITEHTGKSLLDAIQNRAAAMAFEPTELRAVRSWLITAAIGALGLGGFLAAGPSGAAATTLVGIGLSSPRLAGRVIQGTMAAGYGTRLFARKVAPVASAEAMRQRFLQPSLQ